MNHLVGGGMSYRRMREYYTWHGVSHPNLAAITTLTAYHLLNETVEMNDRTGWRVDPIADVYVFDLAGVLVFSSDTVSRFFGRTLNMADWSFMPLYDPETGNLENVGQNYMVRLGLGRTRTVEPLLPLGQRRRVRPHPQPRRRAQRELRRRLRGQEPHRGRRVQRDRRPGLRAPASSTTAAAASWPASSTRPTRTAAGASTSTPGLLRLGPLEPGFTVIVAEDSDLLAGITIGSLPLVPVGVARRFED